MKATNFFEDSTERKVSPINHSQKRTRKASATGLATM